MSVGAPWGLLTLLALGPLVAAYFLRKKQPPRVVSALFLWRSPDTRAEAGPRLKRFSREYSLLLEALALFAATYFLADVRFGKDAPRKSVVVVVDGGFSMRAKVGGHSISDLVKADLAALARSENAAVLTIVESGIRPTVLAGPQMETERALSVLEAWNPAQPAHDAVAALMLAREIAASAEERIVFFTDGPLPENTALPPGVEVRSLGKPLENLAFVSAQRHDEDGQARLTVRVANFSLSNAKVPVTFTAEENEQVQTLELGPGATGVVRLSMKTSADIRVSLPADALAEDSTLTLKSSPVPEVSVAMLDTLEAPAKSALKRFFEVAPGVTLKSPALLTVGPADSSATLTLGAREPLKSFVGPFFAQKTHPLLDDVQLGGIVWTAGENPPGRSLMSAGTVVLISEEENGHLHFNLDLSRSNVQRTVAWPVLLSNVVRVIRQQREGFSRNHVMLGEEIPVTIGAGAKWHLKGADGVDRPVLGVGQLLLPAASFPGKIQLLKDGQPVDSAVVLAIDPRESDLRDRGPVSSEPKEASSGLLNAQVPRSLWPVVVVALLLMGSLMLTGRRPA